MKKANSRQASFYILATVLSIVSILLANSLWKGSLHVYAMMELSTSIIALVIGSMSLVLYCSRPASIYLLTSAGFFSIAFFDGYYSIYFTKLVAENRILTQLPWSWILSQSFLATIICLSYLHWKYKKLTPENNSLMVIYLNCLTVIFAGIIAINFAPLPSAYYPELFFKRPC